MERRNYEIYLERNPKIFCYQLIIEIVRLKSKRQISHIFTILIDQAVDNLINRLQHVVQNFAPLYIRIY